jgi:hypothetical protein
MNTDTPLPQEEPAGQNPPDGAMIDYVLNGDTRQISLEILDSKGQVVRQYASDDMAPDISYVNIPLYWIRPFQLLSGKKGAHRFCWDMRYNPIYQEGFSFPIAAVFGQTAPEPSAPFAVPGTYTARLTADGKTYEQTFNVTIDPRVTTSPEDLQRQHDLSLRCYRLCAATRQSNLDILSVLSYKTGAGNTKKTEKANRLLAEFQTMAAALQQSKPNLKTLSGQLFGLMQQLQECDRRPTAQLVVAVERISAAADSLLQRWQYLKDQKMPAVNAALSNAKQRSILTAMATDHTLGMTHPDTADDTWKPLFDATLTNATFPKGIWGFTPAGELTATEDQCIFSREKYRNFVLDLEFKTAEGTNSGVIVHCSNTDNWIPNSVEIQIADDYSEEWRKADPTWQCGAIFGHLASAKKAVKQPGEWNHYTITCINRQIWVVLNGEPVNHMDMGLWLSGSRNPDGTSIPSWLSKPFATLPLDGHIGLQGKHAGAPIWFRNMRIKAL